MGVCPYRDSPGKVYRSLTCHLRYWNESGEALLRSLDPKKPLKSQLASQDGSAFAWPDSPNWQDSSTQEQCDAFEQEVGGPVELANSTGSRAHHVSIAAN
jgi:xylulokinase